MGPDFRPACGMHVLACIMVCIGMYWVRIYLYLNAIRADLNLDAYIVRSIEVCIGYVLVCIGMYGQEFACIESQFENDCRHSNVVPFCTSFHVSCNIYC